MMQVSPEYILQFITELRGEKMDFTVSEDPDGDCEDFDQLVLDPEMQCYVTSDRQVGWRWRLTPDVSLSVWRQVWRQAIIF